MERKDMEKEDVPGKAGTCHTSGAIAFILSASGSVEKYGNETDQGQVRDINGLSQEVRCMR
jgi:hypothetical protein